MNIVKHLFSQITSPHISLSVLATTLLISSASMALDPPSITIDSINPSSPLELYTEGGVLPDSINVGVTVTSTYGDDPNIGPADNPVNIEQVKLGVDGVSDPLVSATTSNADVDQVKTWYGLVDLTDTAGAAAPTFNTTIEAYAAIRIYYDPTNTLDGHQADFDFIAVTVNINDLSTIDSSDDGDPMPNESQWDSLSAGTTLQTTGTSGSEVITIIGDLESGECLSLDVNGELLEVCIDAGDTSLADLKTALAGAYAVVDNATDALFVFSVSTDSENLNSDGYTLLDLPAQANDSDIYMRLLVLLEQGVGSNTWEVLPNGLLPGTLPFNYTVGGLGIVNPNIMRVFSVPVTRTTGVNSTYTVDGATSAADAFIGELGDSDGAGVDDPTLSATDDHFYEGTLTRVSTIYGFQIELGNDITAPVIFITGQNPLFLVVGDVYTDLGATVFDAVDGISAASVLSDNVNTAIAGDYSVVYEAPIDNAGNLGNVATRTVFVRSVVIPPSGGGGGGGGCFIATAAYGTPMAQEIDTLRDVRDTYMLNNVLGTAFVDTYYRISPTVADTVAAHPAVATTVRILLTPVVALSRLLLGSSLSVMFLGLFLVSSIMLISRKLSGQKSFI